MESENLLDNKQPQTSVSVVRHLINIIIRMVFLFAPIKTLYLLKLFELFRLQNSSIYRDFYNFSGYVSYIPLGLSIVFLGALVGCILDILLPSKYVVGGKIAVKSFNIGTLSWFEGIKFNVKIDVDLESSRKGIAVKDTRE